jgi:hypothetical protein
MKNKVEKSVLVLCENNPRLTEFVKQTFLRNPDKDIILVDDVSDWNFDFEFDYGNSAFALRNEDMLELDEDLPIEDRGWQPETMEEFFEEYGCDFDWDKLLLDNGKVLFLLDQDEYLEFLILDRAKIEEGYAIL